MKTATNATTKEEEKVKNKCLLPTWLARHLFYCHAGMFKNNLAARRVWKKLTDLPLTGEI